MKTAPALFGLMLSVAACGHANNAGPTVATAPAATNGGFSSPEAAFQTLLTAIRGRDFELYRSCFSQEARQNHEPNEEAFQSNPSRFWEELAGMTRGSQTLQIRSQTEEHVRARVLAPEADEHGIGSIAFSRENGEWKISSW